MGADLQDALYKNPEAPITDRVDDLLARMSLEEKLGQMMQLPAIDEGYETYIEKYHLGSYLHALGDTIVQLRRRNAEKSRLGIPLIFGIDAIHGHCFEDGSTVFPTQLATACTWNTQLLGRIGEITAQEAYGAGLDWTFSPVLCMARDPRWGRTGETFGEDSFLIGEYASALAAGYEGAGVPFAACAKHFAAYGEAEGGRDSTDVHVSERNMRTVFLPPFKKVLDAGCKTLMVGYQSLNGVPCSANTWLLNDLLRDEWRYQGVVVTDWNNCGQLVSLQGAASDIEQAVELCLEASNDIFMTTPEFFDCAVALVRSGKVTEERINQSVRRVLHLKFSLGLFEAELQRDKAEHWQPERWQVSEEASRQSITLVKNDGTLPLVANRLNKVLIVGDNAKNLVNQLGDWSFLVNKVNDVDHRTVAVTLEQAMRERSVRGGYRLDYLGADYCGPLNNEAPNRFAIEEAARDVDAIVFCAGDDLTQYGEYHDRADLALPGNQAAVFDLLVETGKSVVTVMIMSKPHTISWVLEKSAAVMIAFNPGPFGGSAIADCLFGDVNPAGRLPISFPVTVGQLPVFYNQAPGWHAQLSPKYDKTDHYVDAPPESLLAFGEGMSYSSIVYGDAQIMASKASRACTLKVNIKNTSARAAVEVVQLYARWCIPGVTSPVKNLIAFKRIELPADTGLDVEFELNASDFVVLDRRLHWQQYKGVLVLLVGPSSRDRDLQALEWQSSE
ncbi:glycoside hydrolase family 3 N-terminal domain-containing protein [Teredinibacter turnerae]|uniref:glycoside hydrolase family 3 N-terminal domain-containing protein n=1 Tax=Teredinibacter turnerae TaxID=2426 RepID=UPI0005F868E7|nr:glycoside hydrolase family 3 N-terminal domain-containing protein [Teredinibacter turnerae]